MKAVDIVTNTNNARYKTWKQVIEAIKQGQTLIYTNRKVNPKNWNKNTLYRELKAMNIDCIRYNEATSCYSLTFIPELLFDKSQVLDNVVSLVDFKSNSPVKKVSNDNSYDFTQVMNKNKDNVKRLKDMRSKYNQKTKRSYRIK